MDGRRRAGQTADGSALCCFHRFLVPIAPATPVTAGLDLASPASGFARNAAATPPGDATDEGAEEGVATLTATADDVGLGTGLGLGLGLAGAPVRAATAVAVAGLGVLGLGGAPGAAAVALVLSLSLSRSHALSCFL